jgi:hypothetical protein
MASQEIKFFCELKFTIELGECIVLCSFSENYLFIFQDKARGYHWNNAEATTHCFTIYFKESISAAALHKV